MEAGLLAHCLHFADCLAHIAFFHQGVCQLRVQRNGHAALFHGVIAACLGGFNQQVFRRKLHIAAGQGEGKRTGGIQLALGGRAVQPCQGRANLAQALAIFGAQRFQLRLKEIVRKLRHIICKGHLLHIQFILNNGTVPPRQGRIRLDIEGSQRLAVFDVCAVARRARQHHNAQHKIHLLFQRGVYHALVHCREIAQVHAFRRGFVHTAHKVLIDAFCHKGDERRRRLGRGDKRGVQRHIGVDVILRKALCGKTRTAAAHIPVRKVVHKLLQSARSLRHGIGGQVFVHGFHHAVHFRKHPAVHCAKRGLIQHML